MRSVIPAWCTCTRILFFWNFSLSYLGPVLVVRLLAHSSTGTERNRTLSASSLCLGAHWTWENVGGERELGRSSPSPAPELHLGSVHALAPCLNYTLAIPVPWYWWWFDFLPWPQTCLIKLILPGDLDFSLTLVTVTKPALLFLWVPWSQGALWENSGQKSGKRISDSHWRSCYSLAWVALLQCTSKKVWSSKSRVSKRKMGNLKEISTIR